jgi:orotidine-5'-phosphate decarboxylase
MEWIQGSNMSQNQLIVALDVENLAAANRLVTTLSNDVKWFKIGKQLFTGVGPTSVKLLHEAQKNIFLDLKFHDIPNTVAGAVASATEIGANIINMHASGGLEMMRAAGEAAEKQASELSIPTPTLLGVTILTSVDETNFQRDFGTRRKLKNQVAYLAELSQKAGLEGVVASPLEIELIRKVCGNDFLIVTPGVRPAWAASNDQQRVMTPGEAINAGADYIVVGRPITAAGNPREAARTILQEIP